MDADLAARSRELSEGRSKLGDERHEFDMLRREMRSVEDKAAAQMREAAGKCSSGTVLFLMWRGNCQYAALGIVDL